MKNQRNIVIGIVGFLVLCIVGIFVYNRYFVNKGDLLPKYDVTDPNNFEFEYTYLGDNKWNYSIIGLLPSPCYKGKVESFVKESYPEQVTVVLNVLPPANDEVCIDVLQDYSYEGTFNASGEAVVEFNIANR